MPYNTRRKSLSLPSLGIHVPTASRSQRSPCRPKVSSATDTQPPPSKKVKRSHELESLSPTTASSGVQTSVISNQNVDHSPISRGVTGAYEHTPPPSPADIGITTKIDTDGINDDIVIAVIQQLEKTGNRPHLIKELATVLSNTNHTVANSANATALLSSRLSLYLKRPWTALSPCPVAKELIPVHPRKVFFYLTTSPHQPLPEVPDVLTPTGEQKHLTPSLSNASVDQDDLDDVLARERARLSPSPEVDLSSPELDDMINDELNGRSVAAGPPTPPGSFSARSSLAPHDLHHRLSHNHRAASPPLEGDEKEFTQTATSARERTSSEDVATRRHNNLENSERGHIGDLNDDMISASNSNFDTLGQSLSQIQPDSQESEYDDYFSSDILQTHDHDQDLDTASAAALFGASPSPSMLSELSSLSSMTSATSDAEPGDDLKASVRRAVGDGAGLGSAKGEKNMNVTIAPAGSAAQMASIYLRTRTGLKRTIGMLDTQLTENPQIGFDTGASDYDADAKTSLDIAIAAAADAEPSASPDTEMSETISILKPVMGLNISVDAGMESWNDLRSPETVEIEELDEIFADV